MTEIYSVVKEALSKLNDGGKAIQQFENYSSSSLKSEKPVEQRTRFLKGEKIYNNEKNGTQVMATLDFAPGTNEIEIVIYEKNKEHTTFYPINSSLKEVPNELLTEIKTDIAEKIIDNFKQRYGIK